MSKSLTMIEKSFNSIIPNITNLPNEYKNILENINERIKILESLVVKQDITGYIKNVWELISTTNKFFNDQKPWELKKTNNDKYQDVLFVTVNLIKQIGVLIYPIMPSTSKKIINIININDNEINIEKIINAKLSGNKLNKISPLFPRVEK